MKLVIEENDLLDGHYAEIYAGGAGVAWSLLFGEYVRRVHVNDIDPAIHAFWLSVLNNTEELCRLIANTRLSVHSWRRQRRILQRPADHSILQLGFATFFLNRTNRSGIIRGGIIGGLEQTGKWKVDARFNRSDLIARVERIARYRNRISLYRSDASDFLKTVLPSLPERSLIYLDPPYYVKGEGLYEHHYGHEDHIAIASSIGASDSRWIVSYDAAPAILRMYKGYRHRRYKIAYSAQDRYRGSEIMFFGDGLSIPNVKDPARARVG